MVDNHYVSQRSWNAQLKILSVRFPLKYIISSLLEKRCQMPASWPIKANQPCRVSRDDEKSKRLGWFYGKAYILMKCHVKVAMNM